MNYIWDISKGDDGVITEVVYLALDSNLPQEAISTTLLKTLQTVDSQPGSISTHYNKLVESPHIIEIHTKWASFAAHKRFMNSSIYKGFYQDVLKILEEGKDVVMFHFRGVDAWGEGKGKVMEIATFFCTEGKGFEEKAREYMTRLEAEGVEGCLGASLGRVMERIRPTKWLVGTKEEGMEDREDEGYPEVATLMISWTEIDAHMKFRESEVYKKMVEILVGFEEFEMHHVEFLEFHQLETTE